MKIKLIYENPEGQGELAAGIAIHKAIEKIDSKIEVEVVNNKDACLELFKTSWQNLFDTIRANNMKTEGNFWTAVQRLEEQLKEATKNDKND